jgi:hypothetical protein
MAQDKGLDRGGTLGQEGELPEGAPGRRPKGSMKDRLDWRDQQKQRGGIGREPSLEDKQKIQPTHQVD